MLYFQFTINIQIYYEISIYKYVAERKKTFIYITNYTNVRPIKHRALLMICVDLSISVLHITNTKVFCM